VGSTTITKDNGEFSFLANRPAGRYELLALTQRGPVSLLDGQIIQFDPQQPLTNLMFRLAPMKRGRWRSFPPWSIAITTSARPTPSTVIASSARSSPGM
jgi:hypothetical protein